MGGSARAHRPGERARRVGNGAAGGTAARREARRVGSAGARVGRRSVRSPRIAGNRRLVLRWRAMPEGARDGRTAGERPRELARCDAVKDQGGIETARKEGIAKRPLAANGLKASALRKRRTGRRHGREGRGACLPNRRTDRCRAGFEVGRISGRMANGLRRVEHAGVTTEGGRYHCTTMTPLHTLNHASPFGRSRRR